MLWLICERFIPTRLAAICKLCTWFSNSSKIQTIGRCVTAQSTSTQWITWQCLNSVHNWHRQTKVSVKDVSNTKLRSCELESGYNNHHRLWHPWVENSKKHLKLPYWQKSSVINGWCSIRYVSTLWLTCWKTVRHSFSNPTSGNKHHHNTATASSCSVWHSHAAHLARAWVRQRLAVLLPTLGKQLESGKCRCVQSLFEQPNDYDNVHFYTGRILCSGLVSRT